MKLKEIMTKEVEILSPENTLETAAQKMRFRDIGFLPVLDGDELIGVLTDRDLVIRALADGMNANAIVGRDLITSPAVYCFDDQDVVEAAEMMEQHQIRRMLILSRDNGRLVGVVSLGDVAANTAPLVPGEVLQSVTEALVKT